ncbi:MAG: TldD/PmbA family protein [Deltaproteobacteria bacterium]|nr:TldD/PmbA family protein [Deltaproteobacteria bacterium]
MKSDMLSTAREGAALARRCGAQDAAVVAYRSRQVSVEWRDGKLEKIGESTTRGLALELFADGRWASVSTSDLRPDALARFVADAVALTRKLEPDPFRALPDPALYRGQASLALDLVDPGVGSLSSARRREMCREAEEAARGGPGADRLVSVSTSFGDGLHESWRVHTNGFEGERRATDFWISAVVSARDADGRRPEEWDAAGARHLAELPAAGEVGRRAAERARARLGARKAPSEVTALVVDGRAAGRLVSALLDPMGGGSLQQRRSFLEGKVGQVIGSPLLSLDDDPLRPRALGSRLFDSEGLAARRFPLFDGGRLASYYLDTYYARKLGLTPTTRSTSNLTWRTGPEGQEGLLRSVGDGFLVTGFLGGNSNSTTGDFSLGMNGFRIRGGAQAEPVAEMNASGNLLTLWKALAAVGNDPYPWSPLRTPTLVFEGVAVAGT